MENHFKVPLELKEHVRNKEEFETLIKKAQKGCKQSQEYLIESNLKLVINLVNRFKGKEKIYEDLFQIGSIGLLKAVERFDLTRGVQFSTYAVPLILGEMKRYLRDSGTMKVSRIIQDNARILNKAYEKFIEEEQKEPKISELMAITELKKEDIALALESKNELLSLSNSITQDDRGINMEDKLKNEKCVIDEWLQKETLIRAFDILEEKEKGILVLRFYKEKTQQEIGEIYGISQAHISRLEKSALKKLRQAI